jgi:thiamine-phosphate pyrophosphorylase
VEAKTGALWRAAQRLSRQTSIEKARSPLPPLVFVTDPARTPDPAAIAARLPQGAGVIYRAFGAADAVGIAQRLRRVADARGLILLIGADADLAARVGADGVHLPERLIGQGRRLRARRPQWLLTAAAHNARAVRRAHLAGLDAALVSPVFTSLSPSANGALGPIRFASLVRLARLPVYALGGVNGGTASRLLSTGAVGLAAVQGLV